MLLRSRVCCICCKSCFWLIYWCLWVFPDLRVGQALRVRVDVEKDALQRPRQSQPPNQQHQQHHVWQRRRDVNYLQEREGKHLTGAAITEENRCLGSAVRRCSSVCLDCASVELHIHSSSVWRLKPSTTRGQIRDTATSLLPLISYQAQHL